MFVRFTKKFCKYTAVLFAYCAAYGGASYLLGLIAPWLFPVTCLVSVLVGFAYFSAKNERQAEIDAAAHEVTMAEIHAKHVRAMDALNRA